MRQTSVQNSVIDWSIFILQGSASIQVYYLDILSGTLMKD